MKLFFFNLFAGALIPLVGFLAVFFLAGVLSFAMWDLSPVIDSYDKLILKKEPILAIYRIWLIVTFIVASSASINKDNK